MKYKEPENLPLKTPQWFKDWHGQTFWHFRYDVESKLSRQGKLLWIILAAILIAMVTEIFTGR